MGPYVSTARLDMTNSPGCAAISCVSGPAPVILTPLVCLMGPPDAKPILLMLTGELVIFLMILGTAVSYTHLRAHET